VQIRIEDWNHDGRGRAREGNRAVLVCQAHPRERVRVHIDRETRGTRQGRVTEILERDPRRIRHRCPHEFLCTGCPLLAAHPDDELAFKRDRVLSTMLAARVDYLSIPDPVRASGLFGYRHFAKHVLAIRNGRLLAGSYVTGTHEVADNTGCPVLVGPLGDLVASAVFGLGAAGVSVHDEAGGRRGVRFLVARHSQHDGQQLLLWVTSDPDVRDIERVCTDLVTDLDSLAGAQVLVNEAPSDVILAGEIAACVGADHVVDQILGYRHRIGPRSFFQINPRAAAALFSTALAAAGSGGVCIDAYAGVGALTLPLSESFAQVIAIERSTEAAAALSQTAARYGRSIETFALPVEGALPSLVKSRRPNVVVLDPPRPGLPPAVIDALATSAVSSVVLLSCGLQALRRDLRRLSAKGFHVAALTPIDQFPRTAHVETVTHLVR
jgi:23S rRNA (uracil-5-)-methyltransferase RumA